MISILAVIFLPNRSLSTMTTSERRHASEADLATVSVPAGMDAVTATGTVPVGAPDAPADEAASEARR